MEKTRKKTSKFNRQEKAIIKTLYDTRRPMSIKEIANKSHMSWITARKYIKKLEDKGWITEDKHGKKIPT